MHVCLSICIHTHIHICNGSFLWKNFWPWAHPGWGACWTDEMMYMMDQYWSILSLLSLFVLCLFFFAADNIIQLVLSFPIRARKSFYQVATLFFILKDSSAPKCSQVETKGLKIPFYRPIVSFLWLTSRFNGTGYQDCISS